LDISLERHITFLTDFISKWFYMSEKTHGKTLAFTVHMPSRCVEIIDELIDAGVYSSRGECIRDIVRSAFREGFHNEFLP